MDELWVLICSGLVFLMQAGFMCLESGLTRAKNSINVAIKNLADFGISVTLFWAFGYGLMFGISQIGWFGSNNFFLSGDNSPKAMVFFLYQAMFCGTATTIISGAVAERLKFLGYFIIITLVSGIIYPLYGHWAWNTSGWLRQIGFVDFAGSTVVHGVGAWVSLATLSIIGARQGRFTETGEVNKIQGSNLPFAVLGTLLLWFGWLGFNGGSTFAWDNRIPRIIVNTVLSGVGGMVMAMALSQTKVGRIEVEELINGSIGGLVAITACCNIIPQSLALIVGATGAAFTHLVSLALRKYRIDDAVDAVAVHGGAGVWGTICVALFGELNLLDNGLNRGSQFLVQLLGIAIAFSWAFIITWIILKVVNQFFLLRVSPEDEEMGLNMSEHLAKTDTYELFQVMDLQAKTNDLTLRVPVEPFTEVGHIATRYNQVMDALEENHRQNIDSLEELYTITATAVSALENQTFFPEDFEIFTSRGDELGILATALQQMVEIINQQKQQLTELKNEYSQYSNYKKEIIMDMIILILRSRSNNVDQDLITKLNMINDVSQLSNILKKVSLGEEIEGSFSNELT
jgi:Amt family ammonium transporter